MINLICVDEKGNLIGFMKTLELGLPLFAPDEEDLALMQAFEKAKAEIMGQEKETDGHKRQTHTAGEGTI